MTLNGAKSFVTTDSDSAQRKYALKAYFRFNLESRVEMNRLTAQKKHNTATLSNRCPQDGASLKKVCSYQDVLDHLNLTADNSVHKLTRPVWDHTQTTMVMLDITLYAILSVVGPSSAARVIFQLP